MHCVCDRDGKVWFRQSQSRILYFVSRLIFLKYRLLLFGKTQLKLEFNCIIAGEIGATIVYYIYFVEFFSDNNNNFELLIGNRNKVKICFNYSLHFEVGSSLSLFHSSVLNAFTVI